MESIKYITALNSNRFILDYQYLMEKQYQHLDSEEINKITNKEAFNLNIGVLGHVDSGKTSLCKVLSQVTSTASLDKNPQSQQRGITLDLGFSAFFTRVPLNLAAQIAPKNYLQFTLVDCPGHASLLKTVIGGAQIIDLMFLVVDINKGIQTQTAECISIGELFIQKMIVVLNKIDSLQNVEQVLPKKVQALKKVFSKTKYGGNISIVPFSSKQPEKYFSALINVLLSTITIPERQSTGPFLMLIDHCFQIKGKGSVVTGTVISGSVKSNDEVEFPVIKQSKKVKSLQMFKKPVNFASQGDRVALLFTQLQSEKIQRGLCCTPNYINKMQNVIINFSKIKYYKLPIKSKSKFHVISGHEMSMANVRLFYNFTAIPNQKQLKFDLKEQYQAGQSYEWISEMAQKQQKNITIYALLSFQKQFFSHLYSTVVGYKFDGDINDNICRLAFSGQIVASIKTEELQEGILKIYKYKMKKGVIDKIIDNHNIIIKDLFKKDVSIQNFIGKNIVIEKTGNVGKIIGTFGNSGKVKAYFEEKVLEIQNEEVDQVKLIDQTVTMNYKKYYAAKQ